MPDDSRTSRPDIPRAFDAVDVEDAERLVLNACSLVHEETRAAECDTGLVVAYEHRLDDCIDQVLDSQDFQDSGYNGDFAVQRISILGLISPTCT